MESRENTRIQGWNSATIDEAPKTAGDAPSHQLSLHQYIQSSVAWKVSSPEVWDSSPRYVAANDSNDYMYALEKIETTS